MIEVVVEPGPHEAEIRAKIVEVLIKKGPLRAAELWWMLREQGVTVGDDRLRKILKQMEREEIVFRGKKGRWIVWDAVIDEDEE